MIILFVSELNSYLEIETTSEMFIDVNRGGEKVTLNNNNTGIYLIFLARGQHRYPPPRSSL